jgi:hypothetical protein
MKTLRLKLLLLTILLGFSSCTFTKRLYTKGYHVDYPIAGPKKNTHSSKKELEDQKIISENSKTAFDLDNSISSTQNEKGVILNPSLQVSFNEIYNKENVKNKNDDCDLIIMMDDTQIKAKVLEITETQIKYKKCSYQDGPTFTQSLTDVNHIKFANGEFFIPEIKEDEDLNTNKPAVKSGKFDGGPSVAGLVFSILATVFSIITWFFSWIFTIPGLVMGLLAIILGAVGSKRKYLKGMGVYSLVMGIITFIVSLIALIILVLLFL